jgi:hypothetical protein
VALRLAASGKTVVHIPEALWTEGAQRARTPAELVAQDAAVRHHLISIGIDAEISHPDGVSRRLHYRLESEPLVSIVIPTRGTTASIHGRQSTLVVDAVKGILERSTYTNLEFVVVADDPTPQEVVDELRRLGDRVKLVRWRGPFNFSAKLNRGAAYSSGDYLVLLNDDVELLSPDWIETMLGLAQQPGIGMVGALLFFEDGTIQHAGHLYKDSSAGHIAFGWEPGRDDALGALAVEREVSGVTAACAMVRANVYAEVGGFSDLLPGNYNDVDFSLKIRQTGRSIVLTPFARLHHFESKSRVATVAPSELAALRLRWQHRLLVDGYWP